MNANRSIVSDSRRVIFIIGLLTAIATAVFLSLPKQAAMQSDAPPISDSPAQPDALGKLAFQRLNFFTSGSANVSLLAVNADGTGLATLAAAGTPPLFCGEPAWSPDGAKIAYVQDSEIYVMNTDGSNKVNITNNSVTGERNPSWSAVANKIAYERDSQIWTMNADGTNQTQFSAITQPSPLAPAWSPDGSKLAFTSGGEIWMINADGTNERRVTNNSTTDADPAWSPDGARIIFGKGNGIAVINLDGTSEMNLTTNGLDGKPSWSNDGTKIAFVRRDGSNGGIFTMDANGANQTRLVADQTSQPGRNENDNPAWQPVAASPDTYTISGRVTRGGIGLNNVTINLTGATTATVTTNAFGSYQFSNLPRGGNYTLTPSLVNVTFTPPSQTFTNLSSVQTANFTATGGSGFCQGNFCYSNGKIAYNFNFSAANFRVATINPDAAGRTIITDGSANDSEPSYSPDGTKIVFFRTNPTGLHRMNADGSGVTRLTSAIDSYPSYSPDGQSIVFVRNQRIFKMNADGTNQTPLTDLSGDNHPAFSPDGVKIAFTRGDRIYTINTDGTNQTQLTTVSSSMPSYSPDGRNIVYTDSGGIFAMNADGTNQTLIRAASVYQAKPSYSPDGTKILFTGFELSFPRIYTMNSDGSGATSLDYGVTADWQPIRQLRRTEFDFDGDLKADVAVFRPSNGAWYRLNSQNNSFFAAQFGIASDKPAPADYDGDGKTDIAVFREGEFGYFYILDSSNNTFRYEQFGRTGDVPLSGDWDGDGRDDVAVYRPPGTVSQPIFFFYRPTAQPSVSYNTISLGGVGDKPVRGDFDGDGKLDAAIFRSSDSSWRILQSSNNQITVVTFGTSGDIPVAADYDGDGKANIAVFRPSNGTWYTSQNAANNYGAIVFGQAGDVPVPADYDGDGRADAAVYRGGAWYLLRSQAGFTGISFGAADDKPVPNAFVPNAFVP